MIERYFKYRLSKCVDTSLSQRIFLFKLNICLAKATNGWCWLTGTYTNGFIRKVKIKGFLI